MKKLFTIALSLTALATISAHDFTVSNNGNTFYFNITDDIEKTVELTSRDSRNYCSANKYAGEIVIPESVTNNGTTYTVTTIGEHAFSFAHKLKSVEIPQSITKIDNYAFYACNGISEITIPEKVAEMGHFVFANCKNLKTLNFNATNVKDFTSLDRKHTSPFYGVPLTEVNIGDNVTRIPDGFLNKCTSLTEISFPESVTEIGMGSFRTCTNLEDIEIPASVETIGGYAFINTAWYHNQPDGLIYINNILYAYKGDMPENTEIIIKEGTKKISACALAIVNDDISKIEVQNNLTSVTIPRSVTEIGDRAFYRCENIKEIISYAYLPSIIIEDFRTVFSYNELNAIGTIIKVDNKAVGSYESAYGWRNFNYIKTRSGAQYDSNMEEITYNVYPNPANEFVYIETSSDVKSMELYNAQGALIQSIKPQGNKTKIQVGNLSDGVYIIQTTTPDGSTSTSKFIKK